MGLQLEAEAQARADAEAVASRAQAALKQHLLESVNVQRDLEEQLHALTLDSTTKVGACVCTTTPVHVPQKHVTRAVHVFDRRRCRFKPFVTTSRWRSMKQRCCAGAC